MRRPYSIYKRGGVKAGYYTVAFWDPVTYSYSRRYSCGQLLERLGEKARGLSPTSKAGAQALADLVLSEGLVLETGQESFGDYLARFWNDGEYVKSRSSRGRAISGGYLQTMSSLIKRLVGPYLKDRGLEKLPLPRVTAGHLEKMILHFVDQGLGSRNINQLRQAVGVPLREALRLGRIFKNPMAAVPKVLEQKGERGILTPEEVRKLFALPWKDLRYKTINLLSATTGMRIGECLGLLHEDVHCEYIEVRHNWQDKDGLKPPKWNSVRQVPLTDKTAVALQALIASSPHRGPYVFFSEKKDRPPPPIAEPGTTKFKRAVGCPRNNPGNQEKAKNLLSLLATLLQLNASRKDPRPRPAASYKTQDGGYDGPVQPCYGGSKEGGQGDDGGFVLTLYRNNAVLT